MELQFNELSASKRKEFRQALESAFPNRNKLRRMLNEELSFNIEQIDTSQGLSELIDELITHYQSESQILDLIAAARNSNSTNNKLRQFCQSIGPVQGFLSEQEIRKIIENCGASWNPEEFNLKINTLERQICAIEIPLQNDKSKAIVGTGFLVGPKVILTTYHTVECIHKRKDLQKAGQDWALPEDLQCHFDYLASAEDKIIREKTTTQLNTNDWLLDFSEPSYVDSFPENKRYDPDEDDLDYALLIMEKPIGSQKVKGHPKLEQRGWIEIQDKNFPFEVGEPIIMPQHPKGKHLQLVISTNGYRSQAANGTRLYYSIKTDFGSSGAPCLNKNLELIGIHQGINEKAHYLNEKTIIPLTAIGNRIRKNEIDLIEASKKNKFDSVNASKRASQNVLSEVTHRARQLNLQPDISIDELNQKLMEQMGDIEHMFRYNPSCALLQKLHQQITDTANFEVSKKLSDWFQEILKLRPSQVSKYDWNFVCLDQHIKLKGVPHMPSEFHELFDEQFPETERDAVAYLLFASKRIDDHLKEVLELTQLFSFNPSPNKYRTIRKKVLKILEKLKIEQDKLKFILNYYECSSDLEKATSPFSQLIRSITKLKREMREASVQLVTITNEIGVETIYLSNRHQNLEKAGGKFKEWLIDLATTVKNSNKTYLSDN